jgi:hypothetical protein
VERSKQTRFAEDDFSVETMPPEKGKIIDYVSGNLIEDKPEERVRQVFERKLVEEYKYSKEQIQTVPEFGIQKGSKKIGPADIVVFRTPSKDFRQHLHHYRDKKKRTKGRA